MAHKFTYRTASKRRPSGTVDHVFYGYRETPSGRRRVITGHGKTRREVQAKARAWKRAAHRIARETRK